MEEPPTTNAIPPGNSPEVRRAIHGKVRLATQPSLLGTSTNNHPRHGRIGSIEAICDRNPPNHRPRPSMQASNLFGRMRPKTIGSYKSRRSIRTSHFLRNKRIRTFIPTNTTVRILTGPPMLESITQETRWTTCGTNTPHSSVCATPTSERSSMQWTNMICGTTPC